MRAPLAIFVPWALLLVSLFQGLVRASKHQLYHHTPCPARSALRIAFVTALTSDYEKTCKPPAPQTLPADFLAYTDAHFHTEVALNKTHTYNAWTRLDAEPYRHGLLARDTHADFVNSYANNNNSFNRAKFFKLNLHRLPELARYHILIWVDATVQVHGPRTAEYVADYLCNRNMSIITMRHIRANLSEEVRASLQPKYTTNTFHGQYQPVQDVQRQYKEYIKEGYKDTFFGSPANAVPVTCFVAFNMLHEVTPLFLERWWMQNLIYSTQDQVSFPYVAWSLGVRPHLLPDERVKGTYYNNTFFLKKAHSLRRLLRGANGGESFDVEADHTIV